MSLLMRLFLVLGISLDCEESVESLVTGDTILSTGSVGIPCLDNAETVSSYVSSVNASLSSFSDTLISTSFKSLLSTL